MPFDLRTTQGRRESPAIHLEARPARGNATNASQPATRPKITRKSRPPPPQAMSCLQTNRSLEEGLPSVLKGKWGTPVPEMAIMLDDRWLGTLAAPHNEMSISIEAPQVVLDMAGQKIHFLPDTRATYSVLICHAGPHASKSCTVTGVSGKPQAHSFPAPLTGQFEL